MVEFHGHHRAWWTGSASASKLRPRMMCSGDHVGVSLIGRASQQEVRLFLGTTITRCLLSAVSPRSHGPLGNLALVREAVRPALDAEPGWTSCPQAISCTICPAAGVILQIPRETFPPPPLSLSLSPLAPPRGAGHRSSSILALVPTFTSSRTNTSSESWNCHPRLERKSLFLPGPRRRCNLDSTDLSDVLLDV